MNLFKIVNGLFSKPKSLYDAISMDDLVTFEKLLKRGSSPNELDEYGQTPIFRILYNLPSHTNEMIDLLIKYGADLNFAKEDGGKPIHHARYPILKKLVENGADVFARNNFQQTALHWAKNMETASYLISLGLGINDRDELLSTPLHSLIYENPDFINFLIVHGADVNAKDVNGWTPLLKLCRFEYADHNDNLEIFKKIEILINAGADPKETDNLGKNSINHALENNNDELAEYLKKLI